MTDPSISRHPTLNATAEDIEQLIAWGFTSLLPTWPGRKFPEASRAHPEQACLGAHWKPWAHKDPLGPEMRHLWDGKRGVCLATGYEWDLLDLDNREAEQLWRKRLPPDIWDANPISRSHKGFHLWIPGDDTERHNFSWEHDAEAIRLGAKYDYKAKGGIGMLPPSRHPDPGPNKEVVRYTWIRQPQLGRYLPRSEALNKDQYSSKKGPRGDKVSNLLRHLLEQPPSGDTGRNTWLTSAAGHLAKWVPYQDAHEALVTALDRSLVDPMGPQRASVVAQSIWETEHTKYAENPPRAETGWLSSGGDCLICLVSAGKGEQKTASLELWSNFDIRARGRVYDPDRNEATWLVEVQTGERRFTEMVPSSLFGNSNRLEDWMAARNLVVCPPAEDIGKKWAERRRVLRYLQSQEPTEWLAIDHFGWDNSEGGVTTKDGVLTPGGNELQPFTKVYPSVRLTENSLHSIGFEGTREAALADLAEVLTFQDEGAAAVLGAWLMACIVKDGFTASVFPILAVEAPAGSGKSKGMFELGMQFGGLKEPLIASVASLRTYATVNALGPLWLDDPGKLDSYNDLLRALATGTSASKMSGPNWQHIDRFALVAPLLITGESLGTLIEQAKAEREILLQPPSARDRMSLHDPTRSQLLDINALKQKHEGRLQRVAGWVWAEALKHRELTKRLPEYHLGSGRPGEFRGILRVGAEILSRILDNPVWVQRVDEWAQTHATNLLRGDNALTQTLLPIALSHWNWGETVMPGDREAPPSPVVVREGVLYVNPGFLAQWAESTRKVRVAERLRSEASIRAQLRDIDASATREDKKQFRVQLWDPGKGIQESKPVYWRLPEEWSRIILDRSYGGN